MYTAEDLAKAYQIGYDNGIGKRPPMTPEQVVQLFKILEKKTNG
jgi:hypothetical protein